MKKIIYFICVVIFILTGQLSAQIIAWETNGLSGITPNGWNASTNNSNLNTSSLYRGTGIVASSLSNAFSSNYFSTGTTSKTSALNDGDYLYFVIQAKSGYEVSLSILDVNFRRSSTGPNTFQWQYSIDGSTFNDFGSQISYTGTETNGLSQTQISLSSHPDLQNVTNSTIITIRLLCWGATGSTGSFAIGRLSGNDLAITGTVLSEEPTTQATNVTLSVASTTSMTVDWTNGNGTNKIVFMKQASSGSASPVDGDTYTANSIFGSGSNVDGWYCVYNGTGTLDGSVTVTGLTDGLQYIAMVCEYNGSGTSTNYNTSTSATNPTSGVLPVELTLFTSSTSANSVQLNWSTAIELNNSGFDIERKKTESRDWQMIGFVQGHGTTNTPQSYSYSDRYLSTGKYNYRLKQIDFNGNYQYYYLGNDVSIGVPNKFKLSQNFPNPFNPVTKISYELPGDSKVNIRVFDMLGREVETLVDEFKTAGYHSIDFDGSALSSGMYFYRIKTDEFEAIKKMLFIK